MRRSEDSQMPRSGGQPGKLAKLVEEASVKFDLSPADGEFLFKFFKEK